MTHKHIAFEQLATRLIEQNGTEVLIVRPGLLDETTYPPTKGADTWFAFQAVQTKLDFADRQEGNTQVGDIKFLLSVADTAPTPNDKLKAGDYLYSVAIANVIAPEGIPLAWKIIARGGEPDTTTYLPGSALGSVNVEGLTLFEVAQGRGYTGTYEEFADKVLQEIDNPDDVPIVNLPPLP